MLQLGVGVGVFEYVHANVTFVGMPIVTVFGVAVNVAIAGVVAALTNTLRAGDVPATFVHRSVYVVPKLWFRLVVCPLVTVPTVGVIIQTGVGVGGEKYVQVQVTFVGTPICVTVGVA